MSFAFRATLLPALCATSLLLGANSGFAQQTISAPLATGLVLADIHEKASPALRDAVLAYAPEWAGCQLLQLQVDMDGDPATNEWVVTPDKRCKPSPSRLQIAWLLREDSHGAAQVLIADRAEFITITPAGFANGGAGFGTVLFQWTKDVPAALASRIPVQHDQLRCGSVWDYADKQYRHVGMAEPSIMVKDPVAGGWVEMELKHYVPDYPRDLCQPD
ncbi:MAG: hypothetical protein PHE17_01900 [Thiothrix sp.]|uniref:hypothetical protein n=1 Tax=Thiothrix sp. TaxID=1032 RepID=UPI0026106C9F|nr:hypothetical protein [Thiothrix sp.]MDD5391752.1 hypothetical protein [Thiothrix sp.]